MRQKKVIIHIFGVINLPKNVQPMGERAFYGCDLFLLFEKLSEIHAEEQLWLNAILAHNYGG